MKQIAFTIADDNNLKWAKQLENSIRKYYSKKDLPFVIIDQKELDKNNDPAKFYRATPYYADKLFKDYDLVVKFDADSIVTGNLYYLLNMPYDVALVYNWNRVDPPIYGEIGLATIHPQEYFNCGLVAMRSKKFIKEWLRLCFGPHFDKMPYREQGFLNILAHYGDYDVLRLDDYNRITNESSWWGLRSKGEWNKIELKDNKLILPQAPNNYPEMEKEIKVLHWGGGADPKKMNYRIFFNEDVIKRLDYLISDDKTNTPIK